MLKKGKRVLVVLIIVIFIGLFCFYWLIIHNDSPSGTVTENVRPSPTAEQCTAQLPLDFLIGQLLMVGINSSDMSSQATVFKQQNIGGAILMTAPANPYDGSINQFKTSASSRGVPPLISTDEEGGDVQRFAELGTLPAPADVAATLLTKNARQLIIEHGEKLKSIGIDMVLGPLVDIAPLSGSVLGNRIFSSNPIAVSLYGNAYVRGWQTALLIPTLKHFPGMGSASANTDYEPATTPELSYLEKYDFTPYHWLVRSDTAVMVGNQNVPGWFDGPASLSPIVNQYLRDVIGYKNNLVVTDSLSAQAIANVFTLPQAIVAAIAAGNDMALFVVDSTDTVATEILIGEIETTIEEAITANTLSKQRVVLSVLRKLQTQQIDPCVLIN